MADEDGKFELNLGGGFGCFMILLGIAAVILATKWTFH